MTQVRCVGYVRVSTEKQVGETKTSLGDQRTTIEALATTLGLTVGRWFVDDGYSGATIEKRPAMQELLAFCESHRRGKRETPGYVLALNDSRWGRFEDAEEATYWRVHLSKRGWDVRFAEGDEIRDPMFRGVVRAIGQAQSSEYRQTVKRNAKRGAKGTAEQGYWRCMAPFGYRRKVVYPVGRERVLEAGQRSAPDERVMLVPHEAEAALVVEMFRRYATGEHSIHSLTDWLSTEAAREHPVAASRRWTSAAVRYTLTNPAYVGDVVAGRIAADKAEREARPARPPAEWFGKTNAHEALVPRVLYERVRRRLAENRRRTRAVRSPNILSGLVDCRCGKHFTAAGGGGTGGRFASYRCVTRGQNTAQKCPYRGAVVTHLLEDAVVRELASVVGSPAAMRTRRARLDALLDRVANEPSRAAEQLRRDRERVEERRGRIVRAVEEGAVTSLEAKERLAELRARLAAIAEQEAALRRAGVAEKMLRARRDEIMAMAMDFRRVVTQATGPRLRALITPWIRSAVFDTSTRVLTMEIRHIPADGAGSGDSGVPQLGGMPLHPAQKGDRGGPVEPVIVRRVKVGRGR